MVSKMVSEAIRIRDLQDYKVEPQDFTPILKTEQGTMSLRPIQNIALTVAKDAGGLVGMIGCGAGKTLISLLLGKVLDAKRVLLLLPASLVHKTKKEAKMYREHFDFELPEILSYEKLSYHTSLSLLDSINPELVICDEAHKLKSLTSTRTKRLGLYLHKNKCKFVVMSGTLLNKSLHDIAHLADWVLHEKSPFPRNTRDVEALDLVLKGDANRFQYKQFTPLKTKDGWRTSFLKRLESVQGVVITNQEEVGASLRLNTWRLKMPEELEEAIKTCFEEGVVEGLEHLDVDVEQIRESDHLWEDEDAFACRGLHQMMLGCLYYWDWQGNRNDEWLTARRDWARALRQIKDFNIDGFDSNYLIETHFEDLPEDVVNYYRASREAWHLVKDFVPPPKKRVWVSDYIIEACKEYVRDKEVILWVDLQAVGERLAEELNVEYYGAGSEIPSHGKTCVMSIKSHGTGKNLQAWGDNLVVHPVSDPSLLEQLIARTHRAGQTRDEVHITFFTHALFGSSLNRATKQAYVISDSTGQPQRLCYADRIKYNGV